MSATCLLSSVITRMAADPAAWRSADKQYSCCTATLAHDDYTSCLLLLLLLPVLTLLLSCFTKRKGGMC